MYVKPVSFTKYQYAHITHFPVLHERAYFLKIMSCSARKSTLAIVSLPLQDKKYSSYGGVRLSPLGKSATNWWILDG
jgi:hypothetical protein